MPKDNYKRSYSSEYNHSERDVRPKYSRRSPAYLIIVAGLLAAAFYFFHSREKNAEDVIPSSEHTVTETVDNQFEATDTSPEPAETPEPSDQPSSDELIDEWIHASAVKQAEQAGVSTEGTTAEIIDRLAHANAVKQAEQAGVSTEGTTAEILERIAKKNLEKYGQ
ncbi:hypothetical protein J6U76_02810 [bacterium]|nr:hypothetical protein [bacterium]